MDFIVTVSFPETDDVAVVVAADCQLGAENTAFARFAEEGAIGAVAMTVPDFESDFGSYTEGMFDRVI